MDPITQNEINEEADRRAALIQEAAMAICKTKYNRSPPTGYECACAKEGRTPTKDIPRCRDCLEAAEAAAPILLRLGIAMAG